ncbi:hypothetical protein C8R41DRAFT_919944 [Lentinula lateritia]|uniref:Uncharacterized protein n=1 Tax=Lentinula lateritia TaxID=40482 RepID=A0ABQ8VFI3_9AGAR|nr:hypothetical protein C8R41DRAFT_919944 [Lentinula lateritia]
MDEQFVFHDPPKKIAGFLSFPICFELLRGMAGCEHEVSGKWPCVGYTVDIDPVVGSLTSLIKKQSYDMMKWDPLEKWDGLEVR